MQFHTLIVRLDNDEEEGERDCVYYVNKVRNI